MIQLATDQSPDSGSEVLSDDIDGIDDTPLLNTNKIIIPTN